jgi:hypothetical protein
MIYWPRSLSSHAETFFYFSASSYADINLLTTPLTSHTKSYFFTTPPSSYVDIDFLMMPFSRHSETYFIDHVPYLPPNHIATGPSL